MIALRTAKRRIKEGGFKDMIRSEADLIAVREGCTFDRARAERPVEFFRRFLVHSKGEHAGQAFEPLPWESEQVLMPLYGWVRADGTRRYRRALIFIARKNGKSTLCSGIGLYSLMADGEMSAEVYCVASSIGQASQLYNAATEMAKLSPQLRKRLRFQRTTKHILHEDSFSKLAVLSPDADKVLGINPHVVLFDELVAQPNRNLWDAIRFAPGARRQPLVIGITTAGWNRESICGEVYEYACQVRDGHIVDSSFLPVVFEAGPEDDPGDEDTWRKANPSLGTALKLDAVREEYAEASTSPRRLAGFLMYRCNRWVSTAEAYISLDRWDANSLRQPGETVLQCRERILAEMEEEQVDTWLGLDCGGSRDLTSLIALFRPEEDQYILIAWIWVPEKCTRPNERPIIEDLIRDGHIETMPGDWTDFGTIEDTIIDLADRMNVRALAYDRTYAGPMIQRLTDVVECVPVAQTAGSLNDACREMDRLIAAEGWRHTGCPALRWTAGNLQVNENRGGQLRPVKPKTAAKIDPQTASITALAVAMTVQAEPAYRHASDFYFTGDRKAEPKSSN